MENIVKADIFFFITSIAVTVFTVGVVVIAVYVVRILRDMKHISKKVSEEGDKIIGDVEYLREVAKAKSIKIKNVADFFFGIFMRGKRRVRTKKDN